MGENVLVVDYKYCTGCHSCEIACRNEKGIPADEWGIKLVEIGPKKLAGKWTWDYLPIPSELCDLCAERLQAGQVPSCELHCLAKCIYVVPAEDADRKAAELGEKVATFRI